MNDRNIIASTKGRCVHVRHNDGTEVPLCDIEMGDDGFWYASNFNMPGYTPPWILRAIADCLDELNKDWEQQIDRDLSRTDNEQEA